MSLRTKDLLTIEDISVEEISLILETAESMKEISTGRASMIDSMVSTENPSSMEAS